ncbi:hypothetical protein MW329_003836 [Vibrio vulnificus]|nr:hypothetical protein [Vibrio vulnificus]
MNSKRSRTYISSYLIKLLIIYMMINSFPSYAKNYNLNSLTDFSELCSGSVSYTYSYFTKYYYCNGNFSASNGNIFLNDGSTIVAYGGYTLNKVSLGQLGASVKLESSNWNATSYVSNSTIYGHLDLHTGIQLSNSFIYGHVKNNVYRDISVSDDSYISGYVEGWGKVVINNSQVNNDVRNKSNNEIYIYNNSNIKGDVSAGTKITILKSEVNGDLKNVTNNDIYIGDNSKVNGSVDAGTKLTVNSSYVKGNLSNRTNTYIEVIGGSTVEGNIFSQGEVFLNNSEVLMNVQSFNHNINLNSSTVFGNVTAANNNWATVYFHNNSVVEGVCLYRTIPENACAKSMLSPVAQYHFDELKWSGGGIYDVVDSSGQFNGKAINNPNLNHDPFLPAIETDLQQLGTCGYAQFNNSNNTYVEINHHSNLSFEDTLTVSAWIKFQGDYPQRGELYTIVAKDTNYEFHINEQGKIYWYWLEKNNRIGTLTSNVKINKNTWYHVTINYDSKRFGDQARLYINGVLDSRTGGNGSKKLRTNFEPLRIGNDVNFTTRSFNGYIDEVNIFNRALSSNEVFTLYRQRHLCEYQEDLTLLIEPQFEFALTCEEIPVLFKVINNEGVTTQPKDPKFTAFSSPGSFSKWCENENGTICGGIGEEYSSLFNDGKKILYLNSSELEQYVIHGSWNGAISTSESQIRFVPFKFYSNNMSVIAGQEYNQDTKVLACDGDSITTIDYTGTPNIDWKIEEPSGGILGREPTFSPVFEDMDIVTSPIQVNESGVFKVLLQDQNFQCSDLSGCPESGVAHLAGSFVVNSRPWTFAICSGETPALSMDGTSSSGTKFKLASERFNLHVKPIVWQSGGAVSGEIETSSFCNAAITQNFFANNAPSAVVAMNSALHSPAGGSTSVLLQGDNGLSKVHSSGSGSGTNQYYDFTQLYWDEVGSLKVMADAQANYLGMDINLGYRNIGRFVPEKLVLVSNSWTYATGHSGFAYMNQPIEHAFSVEAQNASDQVTQNYGLFDSAYVSTVSYFNVDNAHKEIVDRVKDYSTLTWQQPAWSLGALNVTLTQYEFVKKAIPPSPSPYTTEPDGPYTQGFGLWASTVVDGVDFENKELEVHASGAIVKSGKAFSEQPDFRYGRMRLQDVGGFTGNQIEVPLTTEYWNGSQFLTNGDDSGSDFDGSQFCRQLIWHSQAQTSSNASLSGSGTVSVGRSDRLSAQQSTTDTDNQIREQVRFWLRVSDTTLQKVATTDNDIQCNGSGVRPWLRFNWRNLGDEDPNAVVTFGINRGNDRVIYKGESGLTGQ